MKDPHEYTNRNGMDPMVAGAFAVAGLAIGTAATLYLSKKENRDKAQKKIATFTDKAKDAFGTLKSKTEKQTDEMKSKAGSLIA